MLEAGDVLGSVIVVTEGAVAIVSIGQIVSEESKVEHQAKEGEGRVAPVARGTIGDGLADGLVLVSALAEERDVLLGLLEAREWEGPGEAVQLAQMKRGLLSVSNRRGVVFHLLTVGRAGNVAARKGLESLLDEMPVSSVVLFGIAAGVEGRVIRGDVIATSVIWDLRRAKIDGREFFFEPDQINSPDGISVDVRTKNLKTRLQDSSDGATRIHTDLLCGSSDNLLKSRAYMSAAASTDRKVGILEMEACGVAEACGPKGVGFLVVGVSLTMVTKTRRTMSTGP